MSCLLDALNRTEDTLSGFYQMPPIILKCCLCGFVCVACGRHSAVHEYDKCLRLEGTITTAKVSCCLKAQRSLNGQLITVIRQ